MARSVATERCGFLFCSAARFSCCLGLRFLLLLQSSSLLLLLQLSLLLLMLSAGFFALSAPALSAFFLSLRS